MLPSELAPIAIALLAALSVGGFAVALLYPRVCGQSEADRRFKAIAASPMPTSRSAAVSAEARRKRAIEATLREIEEKQKAKKSARPSLTNRMRQAGLRWSKKTYLVACILAGAASFAVALSIFGLGLMPAIGFGATGGLLLPHVFVNGKRNRRFRAFVSEFPNAVDVIVRGVKAGLPLVDCLKIISTEAQEPVRSEFRIILEDQTLGMPLDEAVQRLPERVPISEANYFAIVIAIQSRTGGSLSEALGNLSKVLRERRKMKAKIKAMSSEAKASGGIIGSLPVLVGVLVYFTSPDYIALLFTTSAGNILLAGSALWMSTGIFVMRKMINFDF